MSDPETILALARRNLLKLQSVHTRGQGASWLQQWQEFLNGPVSGVIEILRSSTPLSVELRQNTPFAGALTQQERLDVLRSAPKVLASSAV